MKTLIAVMLTLNLAGFGLIGNALADSADETDVGTNRSDASSTPSPPEASERVTVPILGFGSISFRRPAQSKPEMELAVSQDGHHIALSRHVPFRRADTLQIWNVPDHKLERTFALPNETVERLFVGSNGQRIVVRWRDEATTYDVAAGHSIANASFISSDGETVVTDTEYGQDNIQLTDSASARPTPLPTTHNYFRSKVDGRKAIAVSDDGNILWLRASNSESGFRQDMANIVGFVSGEAAIGSVVQGNYLAYVGHNIGGSAAVSAIDKSPTDTLEAWDVHQRKMLSSFVDVLDSTQVISRSGEMAFVLEDHSIMVLGIAGKGRILVPSTEEAKHLTRVDSLAISPDGAQLARCTPYGAVTVYDFASGKPLHSIAEDEIFGSSGPSGTAKGGHFDVSFSEDGRFLAIRHYNHRIIRVWDLAHDQLVFQSDASAVTFTPDSSAAILAFADRDAPVLHDLASGKEESLGAEP